MRRPRGCSPSLVPAAAARRAASSDETIEQNQVGSTEAAVAATPTGVANCGDYPLPRRMSQYVNLVELDALPAVRREPDRHDLQAGRGDPDRVGAGVRDGHARGPCEGRPASARRVRSQIESGVPPDQAYALIRDDARELANRKAC